MRKRVFLLVGVLMLLVLLNWAYGQSSSKVSPDLSAYFSQLPNLELKEDGPQKYSFVCDYFYLDPHGDLTGKERVSAEYTRALPGGKVQWNNVRVAQAKGFDDPFPGGETHQYMDGLTYQPSSNEIFTNEFFKGFPANEMKTRNLVWDADMFETFAWRYFDKLKLNQIYTSQTTPEDVPLAGAGTFQNRRIELTWVGISQIKGETCALIRYQAFFNKMDIAVETTRVQGRSHYWGEIWVSLKNKQIEYGTLFEDVLAEVEITGRPNKILMNVFRKAVFEKMDPRK